MPRNEDAFAGADNVSEAGAASYEFVVTYYDQTAIDPATLDNNDIRVVGPAGFNVPATLVTAGADRATTSGTARTATYRITPPGGAWDLTDAGTYRIQMQANQVRDINGNAVPAGDLGGFRVTIPNPAALDINALVAAGQATVTHSTFDIGTYSALFDGSTSTLVRTPAINPAQVQIAFSTPQTLAGFSVYFSHAGGSPAYRWQIEIADTQQDMNNKTGSYQLIVPPTGTVGDQLSSFTLAAPVTASLIRLTVTRLTGDNFVHMNEWQILGG